MANDWRELAERLSGSRSSSSSANTSTSSSVKTSSGGSSGASGGSSNDWRSLAEQLSGSRKQTYDDHNNKVAQRVITRAKEKEEEKKKKKWYESELFDDGYQIGDVAKAILGVDDDTASLKDLTVGSIKRGYLNSRYGEESFKAMNGAANKKDEYAQILAGDEYQFTPGNGAAGAVSGAMELIGQQVRQFTNPRTLGFVGTAVGATAIAGNAGPQALVPEEILTIPAAATAAFTAGSAASNLEIEAGHAYNEMLEAGINEETAKKVAWGVGGVNAALELVQVDELLDAYKVTKKSGATQTFTKKLFDELVDRGVDVAKETAQEVAQEGVTIAGTQYASKKDKGEYAYNADDVKDRLKDTAKSSALSFGLMNAPASVKNTVSIASEQHKTNSLTKNEQAVVDKVVADRVAEAEKDGTKLTGSEKRKITETVKEEMDKGYISVDTIEEVLGGEKYNQYKQTAEWEDSLQTEFDTLNKMKQGDMTGEQVDRREALRTQIQNVKATSSQAQLRNQIRDEVMGLVKGDRLAESYNERARTGQKFEADVTQYDTKQQAVVQKAIDSGILNNSNRTHEFVDFVSKISADTGVLFDFSNTQKIREAGFAVEGQTVDGFITKDGITVNIDSPKSRQFVVGHEITHALEGTELYDALRKSVFDYAKMKNQYGVRMESIQKRYKEGTDFEAELTADLVGEYIFSDTDFINNLSTQNRNVFQKVYDEIKYLCKIATAGSKEARELEKVKRAFEKAYREGGKTQGETKYSLSDSDGKQLTKEQQDYFKDSKARDENGNLVKVYHSSPTAGFTVFDGGEGHGNYKFGEYSDGVTFFTDNKAMADSYSPSSEKVDTVKLNNLSEAQDWLDSIGAIHLEMREKDGEYEVYDTDEEEVIRAYDSEEELLRDLKRAVQEEYGDVNAGGQYEGYVNLKNPLIVDAEGRTWDRVTDEFSQEVYDKFQTLTEEERAALIDLAEWEDFSLFRKEISDGADLYEMGRENDHTRIMASIAEKMYDTEPFVDPYQLFDVAADAFSEEIVKEKATIQLSTNDYVERALQAGTYDGVIIKNVIDYGGHAHSTLNSPPGNDYIVFNSNQFKAADNLKPTADPDIRFSLSNPVEETKDLIAVHNLKSAELVETLKLSGLPSPSVAIIKAKDGHDNYGDVSLILPKETIDPQTNKANRIYGSDAWTPTRSNAQVEYEVDYGIQRQFERTIEALSKNVANGIFSKSSVLGMAGIEDSTGLPLDEIARIMSDYNAVQAAYVAENGGNVEVVYRTKEFDTYGNDALKGYIDKVGEQEVARLTAKMMTGERPTAEEIETAKDAIVDNWIEKKAYALRQKPELREIRISRFRERLTNMRVEDFVRHAWEFYEDSGATTDEIDQVATGSNLHSAVNKSDVEAWVAEKLQGLLSEPGIYNGKEIFTPSGRRRSFKDTHWDYTAENIVRAMNNADARGANVWAVSGEAIIATATPEYKNIDEVRADKGRLLKAEYEDYEQIKDGISAELETVTKGIIRTTEHISDNQYDEEQIIGRVIMEAAQGTKTVAGVKRVFQKNGYRIGDAQAKSVLSLFDHASSVPTGYFEAKPQRVVGFDEVGVYVIPYDADVKLKQELLNRGYAIAEYDPKVEGDRTRVLNQFEEYKFSLSNVGEQHTPDSLSALRYDAPTVSETENVAPVAENATVQPETQLTEENATLAPVTAEDMSALFPNDAVPVQAELEQLLTERNQLFSALEIAVDRGSASEVGKLAEEYEALNSRIKALESTETERTGSITDADVPPEMDAPFYGEESEQAAPDDPFYDRDISEVGKRSVNAYQFENPEVKPFFQEAALGMLYDVRNTTKGEKWYNDELYYATGGEQGFGGTKRSTTDDIAELKDVYGYTYDQIEAGLNAIIEDDGAENNAVSKRIEFMLNDRLLKGYTDVDGRRYEPNQGYIKLLNEKQITEYSKEAFDQFMANADQYAPSLEESYAPILNSDPRYEQIAPVYDLPGGQQTYVPTKATYDAAPTDDIAPLYDATGKKGVPDGQQAFMPDAGVEKKQTRKEYHQSIIDNIKSIFKGRGFDFDKVLKNAKNLSTWSTVDNTPQRVMEKALGYKQGGILADITVNKVAQNETEGIKWLNTYVDQLKQISKQYGIKPGSKESAAAQMFAEGFYVNENNEIIRYGEPELIQDFGNGDVRRRIKGLARDPRIRKIYDDTLANINESRARNLYPEIPRLDNYFLHFRAMEDTFSTLGLPFNPNDIRAKDLPTDLNGVTADLKPGQPYFASANHRTGKRTSFDLLGGLERYLNSAKNQIYHIDDIQTLRALRNYIAETYGQATGLEDIDSLTDAEAEERIKQVYDSHLSTFAKFLNEEANVLAGKTALIDRGIEGIIGRRGITFLNALNKQVGSNMVGYNVSSSLTNFLPVAQTFAKTNKFDFTKAFAQTVLNKLSGGRLDSFTEDSPVVIRRKGEDRFYRTLWQKLADPGYALMGMVDDISTEIIARTKYNEFTRKGMDSQKAHFETDKWVSKLMGDRSLGQQPQLYNSKMLGLVTKFQLEVRNQLDSQFYDTIQETKVSNEHIQNGLARNAKTAAKVASVFTQLAVAQHLYGMAFESMAGYNPAFDIIEVLMTAFGFDDEEDSEDTLKDNLGQGFEALMEDLPYASIVTGGGRIPISSALPIKEFFKGEDQYGNEKNRWETLGEVAPYYLMPGGYGQAKKTYQGLKMFSDDHPIAGSYTDAGNLRYDVEDTVGSRIKAGIFGQYASENAQKYFDQEQRTLNPEQTEIFAGLNIPIEEYWEYRDNLYEFYDVRDALKDAAFADDATDEDVLRYTYINDIYGDIYDLYDKQKELASGNSRGKTLELRQLQKQMEQMLSESKFGVDSMKLAGAYAEVGGVRYNKDADSGRWYEIKPKNADGSDNWYYQKEQEVTKGLGISYEAYWNNREEYNYAYDKPGRYAIAQAVGGYDSYMVHYDALENWQSDNYIAADKDAQGNSISGSRKKKVLDYINGLDLDYGERIILYRTVYSSKSDKRTYNQQIIDYLNERDDISYQEMKTILEELEMVVDEKGYITW